MRLPSRADLDNESRLYILVTSDRPDPYINVITHALLHSPPAEIRFVGIKEHEYSNEQVDQQVSATLAAIFKMFDSLAHGQYVDPDNPVIEADWCSTYKSCMEKLENTPTTTMVVQWSELDKELGNWVAAGRPKFDVTTLKKNLLIDVVALLLARGCTEVYSFELLKKPTYDDRDLIHALTPNQYKYRGIAESRHVETARRRMVSRSLTFRSIAWLTIAIGIFVIAVQILFPRSWIQSMVVSTATATSIAAWLYAFRRDNPSR